MPPPKFQLRDPVWWTDPDDPRDEYGGWVIEGRRPNGTYGVIWANDSGGHGGAHEDDLRLRNGTGTRLVPAFVHDAIAEETAYRSVERRYRGRTERRTHD